MNYVMSNDFRVKSAKMRQRSRQKAMKVTPSFLLRQKEAFPLYDLCA